MKKSLIATTVRCAVLVAFVVSASAPVGASELIHTSGAMANSDECQSESAMPHDMGLHDAMPEKDNSDCADCGVEAFCCAHASVTIGDVFVKRGSLLGNYIVLMEMENIKVKSSSMSMFHPPKSL